MDTTSRKAASPHLGTAPPAGPEDAVATGRRLRSGEQEFVAAHRALPVAPPGAARRDRLAREADEELRLAPGATRARGAGERAVPEEPDPVRTCFERDLDRIQHSRPFRRLAGKCQVFIAPEDDHLRTRLTHAIEVAQVAVGIARATGLNIALTAAAAMGHDCGHGPAGHASEEALSPYLPEGYHHAVYGADVTLSTLNLCDETLDAVRNHSWNRPSPRTPEGEVVAWADRIAYVCHDFEDAVRAGTVREADLPHEVREVVGARRSRQLHAFITAMVDTIAATGRVGMRRPEADALAVFRAFNFQRIYLRPASVEQAQRVIRLLRGLVELCASEPERIDDGGGPLPPPGSPAAVADAVRYVSGMTDRFALAAAVELLGWDPARLPRGV
ncbi:MAG TPA: HD domain-containing protein [Nitriliruptorales bacterium]|nr:HD domain-containing protein [Nitriliruptorales bacterium]